MAAIVRASQAPNARVLFGPLAALVLASGIVGLPFLVPGYDQIRQTVSEIGEMDSPARIPFAAMLVCVALCLVVFASAVRDVSKAVGRPTLPAWFIAFMAIPAAGVGVFAYPHPLHNWFGLAELVGYQAPLVLALSWRGEARLAAVVKMSWLFFGIVWVAIVLNLGSLDHSGSLWQTLRPVYGIVQRALFASWFGWCALLGVMLYRDRATA